MLGLLLDLNYRRGGLTVEPSGLTPQAAIAKIRAARAAGDAAVWTVAVKGFNTIREPLVFTPADSGTAASPVRWIGEKDATIAGGETLTGWKDVGGVWECAAPKGKDGKPVYFEQLWVNGRRAARSVWPKKGYAYFAEAKHEPNPDGCRFKFRNTFKFDREVPKTGTDWAHAHLVVIAKWSCSRQIVGARDPKTDWFSLDTNEPQPPWKDWNEKGDKVMVTFENVDFGFTDPGDWFYDYKAGVVRYRPLPDETLDTSVFLAPTSNLRELVKLAGDPEKRAYVQHITFDNIAFEAAAAQDDNKSPDFTTRANAYQAGFRAPGAIDLEAARNVRFENCRVTKCGSYAFRIVDGSMSNVISRCTMNDLGGGGVLAGACERNLDHSMMDERLSPRDDNLPCPVVRDYSAHAVAFIEVSDCEIADAGKMNHEGVGVLFTNISDSKIVHNDIHDILYSGVSVGWVWGYRGSVSQRNEVSFNRITNLGDRIMSDLAGVYTLGTSHGTVVSNNVISNVKARYYGGWGLYTDEGSEGIVMENNLVYDTFDGGFHQHYGRNNVIRNNIFAFSERDQVSATSAENHLSAAFLNNIVYWNKRDNGNDQAFIKYEGTVSGKARIIFLGNLWWNAGAETFLRKWFPFSAWQREGNDIVGAAADPKFVDAAKRDFRLRPDSPAFALGFKPWDITNVGPRQ